MDVTSNSYGGGWDLYNFSGNSENIQKTIQHQKTSGTRNSHTSKIFHPESANLSPIAYCLEDLFSLRSLSSKVLLPHEEEVKF